jgi:hypothetical protein
MHSPDLRPLAVSSLIVDPEVQRSLDVRRVEKIAADLSHDALGTITVSHRANGSYHIIDGQHRVSAVRLAEGDSGEVMCRVFQKLTVEEEAAMFRLLNATAKPGALDLFRIRVVEREEVAVHINDMLDRNGFRLGLSTDGSVFAAVAAAERIYRQDPNALEWTLSTIVRAWGRDGAAADGRIVSGLGMVYIRYGTAVDPASMADKLARFAGGPAGLIGKSRGLRDIISGPVGSAVSEIIVETYNRSRKTRALPPWRTTN